MDRLTDEQAAAIGRVLETADGGCYYCAQNLADEMAARGDGWWRTSSCQSCSGQIAQDLDIGYQMVEKKWDPGEIKGGKVVYRTDDAP